MEKDVNIEFLKTVIKAVVIALIFVIPLFIMFITKLDNTTSIPMKKINNQKDFVLYVTKNKCTTCDEIKKILKNYNVKYIELNVDKTNEFERVAKKLDLNSATLELPSLIYIREGKLSSYLTGINEENELITFIEYNETKAE